MHKISVRVIYGQIPLINSHADIWSKVRSRIWSEPSSTSIVYVLEQKRSMCTLALIQEVFHVYLNKFEIAVSHLFRIIFSNNKFTLVYLISRNAQPSRK